VSQFKWELYGEQIIELPKEPAPKELKKKEGKAKSKGKDL